MGDRYKIASLFDFLSVPEDRIDDCLKDFAIWLSAARDQKNFAFGIFIFKESFIWVDDGNRGISDATISYDGREIAHIKLGHE